MPASDRLLVSGMQIILFGSEGGFSRPVLKQLLKLGLSVIAVVMVDSKQNHSDFPIEITQPVRPGGFVELAGKHRIDVLRVKNLNNNIFLNQLKKSGADIFLVACFGQILPASIWQKMKTPCWNLHPSLLPKYRGPSPLYWQIKNGESDTGLSLHEVSDRIDSGKIVARRSHPLPENQGKISLDNWVSEHGVKLFYETLLQYLHGELHPEPQDEASASYYPSPQQN